MPVAAPLIGAAGGIAGSLLGKPKTAKDPNKYLAPYLQGAAGTAQDLFNQGGPKVYDGSTVAGPGDVTQQAQQAILQRAQSGNPLIGQAQNFVSQGLNSQVGSDFGSQQNPFTASNPFGGASNPYLDQMFQHAAGQGQQSLDSAYARGGRNIGAGQPASADMLSNLASSIYAPAYENDRNRQLQFAGIQSQNYENAQGRQLSDLTNQRGMQQNLLGYAAPLANQDYADLSAAQGVGAQQDAQSQAMLSDKVSQFNQQQQAPYANFQNYLSSLSSLAGKAGQPQQPMQSPNYLGAGLGGAMLASQLYPQQQPYQPSPTTPPFAPAWGSGFLGPVGFGGG